uniref:Uncharacterized protein n=1 Tax=Panagrolaimus davidi TaxID=227884 RepID=A0A914QDK0_9BILA
MPSICTKDEPYLTEECYFSGTNCLKIFDISNISDIPQTIMNYLFWQIMLFVFLIILMVFGEGRSTVKDGYEEV